MRSLLPCLGGGPCDSNPRSMKLIHSSSVCWSVVLIASCLTTATHAATVSVNGYTNSFSTLPAAADWSYINLAGGNSTYTTPAQLDAAVAALPASSITTQLNTDPSPAAAPGTNAFGNWNQAGLFIHTRPTGNGASIIMCTLVNGIGNPAGSVTLSYDFTRVSIGAEDDPAFNGHRAYYSLTGLANSWTVIPEFTVMDPSFVSGRLTSTLNIAWPSGGTLYVLWADDNGVPVSPDTALEIDNFSAMANSAAQVPVAITNQPQAKTVVEGSPAGFSVGASGNPAPAYQWYRNNTLIDAATNATYGLAFTVLSDNQAQFQVVAANTVSNTYYAVTSSVAVLTVQPDTNAPLASYLPVPGTRVLELSFLSVLFNKSVTGVDASDLLINGVAASSVATNNPNDYTFYFPQPATGTVQVAWATNHGITDVSVSMNPFGGGSWTYNLDTNLAAFVNILISEFMADNGTGIKDEDGSHSDWIELLNAGLLPTALDGWFLTDTPTNLTKWQFPAGMPPFQNNSYLVVWASAKNRTNPLGPLHTNFKLGREAGNYLALVDPNTNVVSAFNPYPLQQADVSYGRDFVDPNLVGYFTNSTPGKQNATTGLGFSPNVLFSVDSGLYTNATLTLVLSVSNAAPGTTIRYTVDASAPTTNSPVYSAPIVFGTNVIIKARAFPPAGTNLWPSQVLARNYIFLDNTDSSFNSSLPLLIITTQGQAIPNGIIPGGTRPEGTLAIFDTYQGRSSVRSTPEYIGPAGFEAFGQTSVGFAKPPIRIETHDALANDVNAPLLGMPAGNDWKLRNPFDDKTLLNDFLGYELFEKMGHYSCRRRFVDVFINAPSVSGSAYTDANRTGRLRYPDDYAGVEVLFETIASDNNRVDIPKITPYDTNEPSITGGWILKKDKDSTGDINLTTGGGNGFPAEALKIHEPKVNSLKLPAFQGVTTTWPGAGYTASASNQLSYILNYLNQMEKALYAPNWLATNVVGTTNHWSYYLDADSWVDFHWLVEFSKQIDGIRLSDYFHKDRGGKIEAGPIWDWNLSFGNGNYLRGGHTNGWYYSEQDQGITANEHLWLRRLINGNVAMGAVLADGSGNSPGPGGDPDFNQKIVDRWSVLRTNVLNGTNVLARIDELSASLNEAAQRDLWGKWRSSIVGIYQWPNPGGGLDGSPVPNRAWDVDYWHPTNYLGDTATSIIGQMKKWVLGRYLWIDSQFTPQPAFGASDGMVTNGFSVSVTPQSGAVLYYTLDGTDPRAAGGGVAPAALTNNGPANLTINSNVRIFARAKQPTNVWYNTWSAPIAVTLFTAIPSLRITEIMYHPAPAPPGSTNSTEDFEYIEVKNIGATPLNVNRFSLGGGVQFQFPNVLLAAGQSAVIVANVAAFQSRYGASALILGTYTGNLNNSGDHLVLSGNFQEPVLDFSYTDAWYPATDGLGFSLVTADENAPTSAWNSAGNWRASSAIGGSAGQDDPAPPPRPAVLVNEVLSNEDPPQGDAIELFNSTGDPADISGWFLTDDFNTPTKFTIPAATVIPAGGTIVFYSTNSFGANGTNSFGLGAKGDQVYLFSGNGTNLTGYGHGFDFGVSAKNVTFGRYVISTGKEQFVAQVTNTLGGANAGPLIGPIVVSKINYHPADIVTNGGSFNNTIDEFIELQNASTNPVPLYDVNFATNTWHLRDAVDYHFPTNVVMPPGGFLLVVSFDPAADANVTASFRSRYNVPADLPIYGPWQGHLDNGGARVEIARPDAPTTNDVPYILLERVEYSSDSPWPLVGLGAFIRRVSPTAYGNDPANWVAPVAILRPPQSRTVRIDGANSATNLMLSVTLAGGSNPIAYQWLLNGTNIPGANSALLNLSNAGLSQSGNYSVVVSNPFNSVTSAVARVDLYTDSGWRFTSLTGDFNNGTNVDVYMQAAGEVYIDDVSLVPATGPYAGINVVTNGDFEAPLTVGPWLIPASMSNSARTNNFAHSGSYSLHVVATSSGNIILGTVIKHPLPPVGSNVCTLSFWYHTIDSTNFFVRTFPGSAINNVSGFSPKPTDTPPGIAAQPNSLTLPAAAAASFGVSAYGSEPFSYQWFKDGTLLADGGKISGANAATLTISPIQGGEMGNYSVRVSNAIGVTNSTTATLVVTGAPPEITLQPQSQTVPCHASVIFTVAATGSAPLVYQWRLNQMDILNETNTSLTLTDLAPAANGAYSVAVSNPAGTTNSADANLVVTDPLASLGVQRNGTNLVVTWPVTCTIYQLEETTTFNPVTWGPPSSVQLQQTPTQWTATIPIAGGSKFYRLRN